MPNAEVWTASPNAVSDATDSAQFDRLAAGGDALDPHLGGSVPARVADDRHRPAGPDHRLGQAAGLHPRGWRQHHVPGLALPVDCRGAVRVGPRDGPELAFDGEDLA